MIRQSDSSEQVFPGGKYQGTTAQIAKKLQREAERFSWLRDAIFHTQELPVTTEKLQDLRKALVEITPEQEVELKLLLPDPDKEMPPPEVFDELLRHGDGAKGRLVKVESLLQTQTGQILEEAAPAALENLNASLSELIVAMETAAKRPLPWISTAIYEILTENDTPWRDLLRVFSDKLDGLKQRAEQIDSYTIEISSGLDRKRLLEDTLVLKKHLDRGGGIGWGPFKPKAVRDNLYIAKCAKVDGQPCDNQGKLDTLIQFLLVEQDIDYCWKLWTGRVERKSGRAFLQVAELEELKEALTNAVGICELHINARNAIRAIKGCSEPRWFDQNEIRALLRICDAVYTKWEREKLVRQWKELYGKIQYFAGQKNAHPILSKALEVLGKRGIKEYAEILDKVRSLRQRHERAVWAKDMLETLRRAAPLLAEELSDSRGHEKWNMRFEMIQDAWAWRRAQSWLTDFLNKEDLPALENKLAHIERDISETLGNLASQLAWKFCFDRMTEQHRRNLIGWQQAITRLGKGTGKHAPVHRKDAQIHLNKCKDAVPAWIMPIHRVYDTVQISPEVFDVIIVDEASQCGFEGLPLTYLTKQLLIVGDDKQISPDPVGVERGPIYHQKINEFLFDFEEKDLFYIENSLFSHAERRFGKNVVLLEHFRCMPEIIQFSNDNWYHSSLIPLKQYPPERYEPLITKHIPDGRREGEGTKTANRPEAQALVEQIIQCCQNGKYDNRTTGEKKTMGVITLQGSLQAPMVERMLIESLGPKEMEERRLICGDAYSFQGDERDVIFLSMVAAPNMRSGVLNKVADQQRFNVACSRAREQMWLFHSSRRNDLSKECMRWKLLEYFENPEGRSVRTPTFDANEIRRQAHYANRSIENAPKPFDSWFEVDVALNIVARKYRVLPQYAFAGKRIDLVIQDGPKMIAVECDGDQWHGLEQYEEDVERQRQLERCGWYFHRIRECEFYAFREATLNRLWSVLDRYDIKPIVGAAIPCDREEPAQAKVATARQGEYDHQRGKPPGVPRVDHSIRDFIMPKNIHDALKMKPALLREVVIETLRTRPNHSCVKEALPGFVLKQLEIISRAGPREQFSQKVFRELRNMEKDSIVEVYKATNIRVRLLV